MTAQDWVSTVRECLILGATVAGVVVAKMGLTTWRKQLTGRAEWKLARRLLRSVYKVRDALNALPMPGISGSEIAAARESQGIEERSMNNKIEVSNDSLIAAYHVRWRRVADAYSALKVEALEAEVLWDKGAKEAIEDLSSITLDAYSQLEIRLWELANGFTPERRGPNKLCLYQATVERNMRAS